MNKIYFL